jgi:3-methylfumaryl-CoA hydratase
MNQTENPLDEAYLRDWIGNQESIEETIAAEPLHRMRAALDLEPMTIQVGEAVPPLWHWAYFLTPVRASELGRDGHPALGSFMPPVPLPRRMWAGGQFQFSDALRVGDKARKQSTVRDVKFKEGRTGKLCFVEVEHCIYVGEELRIRETHNIVYRDIPQPGSENIQPAQAPADAEWSRDVVPNSTLLFRYSALTFNGHRIHYDLDFCRQEEGYPGLVFHGPLSATLLVQLAIEHNPGKRLAAFEFRALSPLFDNAPFTLNGRMEDDKAIMWASNAEGQLAMKSTVTFAD